MNYNLLFIITKNINIMTNYYYDFFFITFLDKNCSN